MNCPKCKSENVTVNVSNVMKSQSRSIIWNLFMVFVTGGLWILWMLIRKRKEKVVTIKTCLCQNCAYSWNIK